MRNIWKVGALGAVFGAVLSVGGCQDFDAAYEKCVAEGRCEPDGGVADGGEDGGVDSGPVDIPDCGPVVDAGVDYPDLTGQDLDCDGVDGVASAGFFVDPSGGNDDNNGSQTHPVKTLDRALQLIRDGGTGRTIVYLGTGTYNEAATVVDIPVSLYGGYTWQGNGRPYWERFKAGGSSTTFDGGPLAFTVRDVTDGGVLLEGLQIVSANANDAGEASIALRVIGTPEIQLRQITLEAGFGAEGQAGAIGRSGAAGGKGDDGNPAITNSTSGGDSVFGGTSSCATGDDLSGGRSGNGINRSGGIPGFRGNPTSRGGAGGDGGAGASLECNPVLETCSCTGLPGFPGDKGTNGDAGAAGRPGVADLGQLQLDAGTWMAHALQHGEPGKGGTPGAGGGGGGSGGGCPDLQVRNHEAAGSGAGGGGGAGGCSGEGGGGGMAGGASIALLLIDSNVVVEGRNQFTA
ncbi:DUF1565 domain-containing protein, partial [Corallococcus terminator]|uniref:DUF1565 domain-containing protein n=1 Tax=Corallococcus terminator TaxID=2316733 RepID=UPI0011C3BF76